MVHVELDLHDIVLSSYMYFFFYFFFVFRHEGPVWQVAWAHPKFGSILASCSYDRKVRCSVSVFLGWTYRQLRDFVAVGDHLEGD